MNKVIFVIIMLIIIFVAPILTIIIVDKIEKRKSSSLYDDDVKNFGYAYKRKKRTNQIDKDLHDKRRYYIFCIKDRSVVDGDKIYHYLRKIDEYLTSYNLEQFDRFYTVYCKELYNTLTNISKCKYAALYYDLVMETRKTYGSIFSKILTDVETAIKNDTTSDTDIEGIKNFAKINGDFDENYKAETADNSVGDTGIILTSTTSAVENNVTNYSNALAHAYEKVSHYKKENARLAKELENCRAEAKKHRAKNIDNADSAEAKLKSDLERLNEVIHCQERAGCNGAILEFMRQTRHEIIKYVADYGLDHYNDYELYCCGIPINDYLKNWEAEFDYTHDYAYYTNEWSI